MYFFGKNFLKDHELAIMLIFSALAPIIVRRYATFVSEEFAFALVPWIFYLFLKKKNFLAGILIAAVGLIHFRTFGMVLLVVFSLLVYYLTRKNLEKVKSILKTLVPVIIIAVPWYVFNFSKIISLSGYENPYINETIALPILLIGLPLIVFSLLFFILRATCKFNDEFWFLLAIPLLFLGGIFVSADISFPYRAAIFLVIPLAVLSGAAFSRLFDLGRLAKFAAIVLLVLCFAYSIPYGSSPYTKNHEKAADFIIEKYGKNTSVLADYEMSYLLAYKGALVYVGPYMERFPDASDRMRLVHDFATGIDDLALQSWKPECILLRQNLERTLPAGYREVYSNPEAKVFCYLG